MRYVKAVALELSSNPEIGPIVSALGEHAIAAHIVACAKRYGVPIVERPDLCEAMSELECDDEIPPELFEAAAAVLEEVGGLGLISSEKLAPSEVSS